MNIWFDNFFFFYITGNMWIGWDNQSTPVRIGFQFDQLRKFQLVSIHVNNFVSQGAQVSIQLHPPSITS